MERKETARRMVANFFIWLGRLLENWRRLFFAAQEPYRTGDWFYERKKCTDFVPVLLGEGHRNERAKYGIPESRRMGQYEDRSQQVEEIVLVIRYTRRWVQYGIIAHAVICIVIAAVEQTLR